MVRLRSFQERAIQQVGCPHVLSNCQRPNRAKRRGWLGAQDSNLDWRIQSPQSCRLDDLPKTRGSPVNRTLPYRLRAECSALELETPLEFDEHEFVIEFHGAVLPLALSSEGTPFPFDPSSHRMELECLLLRRSTPLARDKPVPSWRARGPDEARECLFFP